MGSCAPLRILHILRGNETGGAGTSILSLIKNLRGRGLEVSLLLLREQPLFERALACGIKARVITKKARIDVRVLWSLRRLLDREDFQIVHTHSIGSNLYGRLATLGGGHARLVTTVHADTLTTLRGAFGPTPLSTIIHMVDRRMSALSDRLVAVSNALREQLVAKGVPRSKLVVIRHGVDLAEIDARPVDDLDAARRAWGIEPGQCVVGTVGRLVPVKNHALLLQAARDVVATGRKTKFLIVGDGPLEGGLRQQAERLEIGKHVVFAGWRRDPQRFYGAMDVFVLPSHSEGMPMALLEAMAYRKPVIATRVGGIPEAVQDGHTGFLIAPGDRRTLSQAITQLVDDRERCRAMGEAGRTRLAEQFTTAAMASETADLYRQLMTAGTWHQTS